MAKRAIVSQARIGGMPICVHNPLVVNTTRSC